MGVGFSVRITDHMTSLQGGRVWLPSMPHRSHDQGRGLSTFGGDGLHPGEGSLHSGGRGLYIQWVGQTPAGTGKADSMHLTGILSCYKMHFISVRFGRFAYRENLNTQKIRNLSFYSYLLAFALPMTNQINTEMLSL